MPYTKPDGTRDYRREYDKYASKPAAKKDRAQRNAARSTMIQAGKASKGDGRDIGHKTAISKGGSNTLGNLFSQSKSENRSFAKNKNSKMISERSKREK